MAIRNTGLTRFVSEQRYGGPTRSFDGSPLITTTPARVASNKPDRVGLYMFNIGTVTAFLALSGAVSSTNGIPLTPNSAVFMFNSDDDTLPSEAWFAVTASSTTIIYVVETVSDTILAPEVHP